jgi:hypothetical protein
MKLISLLFAFTVFASSTSYAQQADSYYKPQTIPQIAYPVNSGYYMALPPAVIYRPQYQIQLKPYSYGGSIYNPKTYRTPLRNWLFGTGNVQHYYYPQQPQ